MQWWVEILAQKHVLSRYDAACWSWAHRSTGVQIFPSVNLSCLNVYQFNCVHSKKHASSHLVMADWLHLICDSLCALREVDDRFTLSHPTLRFLYVGASCSMQPECTKCLQNGLRHVGGRLSSDKWIKTRFDQLQPTQSSLSQPQGRWTASISHPADRNGKKIHLFKSRLHVVILAIHYQVLQKMWRSYASVILTYLAENMK